MDIIKITTSDLEDLKKLGRQTFIEAFKDFNSEENMKDYLEKDFNDEKLLNEINNPDSEFYFARIENERAGYLKINFREAQTEYKEQNGFEIQRIYVLKEFLGAGVGQILFEKALQIAVENKMDYAWLGVWEHNTRAINFYKKNGFTEYSSHLFYVGDDKQTDIIMKLDLK